MIRLTEESASLPVSPVYLIDHGWQYQNPRFHPLQPALKTRCFTPPKLQPDAVPESTVFSTHLQTEEPEADLRGMIDTLTCSAGGAKCVADARTTIIS